MPNRAARSSPAARPTRSPWSSPRTRPSSSPTPTSPTVVQGVALHLVRHRLHADPAHRVRDERREDPALPAGRQRRRCARPLAPHRRPLVRAAAPLAPGGLRRAPDEPTTAGGVLRRRRQRRGGAAAPPSCSSRPGAAASRPSPARRTWRPASTGSRAGSRPSTAPASPPTSSSTATSPRPAARRRCVACSTREPELDGVFAASSPDGVRGARTCCARSGNRCRTTSAWSPSTTTTSPSRAARRSPPSSSRRVEQGRRMADVLLRLIDGEHASHVTMMPTRIIERASE